MKNSRHLGIEFCRILAMLMICNLHVLGMGGILEKVSTQKNLYYIFANSLEAFSYSAVNIYILISGYVGLNSKFSYKKMFSFWLQIIFYTISITLIFAFFSKLSVNTSDWFSAFTPISHGQYWYMSCYFALMLVAPFINQAILTIKQELLLPIVIGGFVYFSIIPTIFKQDSLGLWGGYSVLWMILLYMIGAIINRLEFANRFKVWQVAGIIILLTSLTFLLHSLGYDQWRSYISPTVVLQGISIFLLCLNLKNLPFTLKKIVLLISPLTLGVYRFHVHPLIFRRILPHIYSLIDGQKFVIFVINILLMSLLIFIVGAFIEYLRKKLFIFISGKL